jgi:hypothetical protein
MGFQGVRSASWESHPKEAELRPVTTPASRSKWVFQKLQGCPLAQVPGRMARPAVSKTRWIWCPGLGASSRPALFSWHEHRTAPGPPGCSSPDQILEGTVELTRRCANSEGARQENGKGTVFCAVLLILVPLGADLRPKVAQVTC